MLYLDLSESLLLAQALNPPSMAHLLLILNADEVQGDYEGATLRQRAHCEAMLNLIRTQPLFQPAFTRPHRCPIYQDLLKELATPTIQARRPSVMKRLVLDALIEMIELGMNQTGKDPFRAARARVIGLCVDLLTQKCLSMPLKKLRDFRFDQRKAYLLQELVKQNPAFAKVLTDSLLDRYIIPQVTKLLQAKGHYIRIRRPKKTAIDAQTAVSG